MDANLEYLSLRTYYSAVPLTGLARGVCWRPSGFVLQIGVICFVFRSIWLVITFNCLAHLGTSLILIIWSEILC